MLGNILPRPLGAAWNPSAIRSPDRRESILAALSVYLSGAKGLPRILNSQPLHTYHEA